MKKKIKDSINDLLSNRKIHKYVLTFLEIKKKRKSCRIGTRFNCLKMSFRHKKWKVFWDCTGEIPLFCPDSRPYHQWSYDLSAKRVSSYQLLHSELVSPFLRWAPVWSLCSLSETSNIKATDLASFSSSPSSRNPPPPQPSPCRSIFSGRVQNILESRKMTRFFLCLSSRFSPLKS